MGVHPVVLVIGLAIILSPLVVAVRIENQARRFQREAFGHLSRAALALRQATWGVMAFYLLVVGGSFATGQYHAIFDYPLGRTEILVYVRILAVTVAYLLFGRVANHLHQVTVPGGHKARGTA